MHCPAMFNTLKFHSSLGLSGNSLRLSLLDTAMRGFSMGRFTPVPDFIVRTPFLDFFRFRSGISPIKV